MSYTTFGATATCTVEGFTDTASVALAVYDYLVNHPDEIPEDLDDEKMDSATVFKIESYLSLEGNELIIKYDSEEHYNYDGETFNFLTSHFATLQSSPFMKVNWATDCTREGMSSGTDYYGKDGNQIDVESILSQHFAN